MKPIRRTITLVSATMVLLAASADAACVNKFLSRSEGMKQSVTLLTGMLTFPEAKELSQAIKEKRKAPLEWLDDSGKMVSRQIGDLKVVQPMPVSCGARASGVVLNVTFLSGFSPKKKVKVKLTEYPQ